MNEIDCGDGVGAGREQCRPDLAGGIRRKICQFTVGCIHVALGQAMHGLTEGEGHGSGFTRMQHGIAQRDVHGRRLGVDAVAARIANAEVAGLVGER